MNQPEHLFILLWRFRLGPWQLAAVVNTEEQRDFLLRAIRIELPGFQYGWVEGLVCSPEEMIEAEARLEVA